MIGKIIAGLSFTFLALLIAYDLYKSNTKPLEGNNYKLFLGALVALWIGVYFIFYF